jgi:Na+/melibiose symporter-like transporter
MSPYMGMFSVWGVVTLSLVILLIYKSRLTNDDREEKAIKSQSMIEMKTKKLVWPIRALSGLSVLLLFVILVYWIYTGVMTPPPPPS